MIQQSSSVSEWEYNGKAKGYCEMISYDHPLYIWSSYVNNIVLTLDNPESAQQTLLSHVSVCFRPPKASTWILIPKMVSNKWIFPLFAFKKVSWMEKEGEK